MALPHSGTSRPSDPDTPGARPEHESKYVLAGHVAPRLLRWLDSRCRREQPHGAGIVSSVYYDTPDWALLGEKLASDYLKTKVRVRWYSDFATGSPVGCGFLEAKAKTGARRTKVRRAIEQTAAELASTPLTAAVFRSLPRTLAAEGVPLRSLLLPAFEIRYRRMRWVEPTTGLRLCLDWDIHVPRVAPGRLPPPTRRPLAAAVFELKGPSRRLPATLRPLMNFGLRKDAFSKYSACYRAVTGASL